MGGYMEALIDSGLKVKYDARQSELERLFGKYGKVDRVDMKSGFAFIYMDDERDAGDAIQALDRTEFGRHGRWLCVEWTKIGDTARACGGRTIWQFKKYALRDDDDRRNGYSPERRHRYRSLARRGRDSGRTPSPYVRGREKDSPDSG